MNEMNRKKLYILKLANFLVDNETTMSGKELADHLNRNGFLTSYGTEYAGGRGTYKLLSETYNWIANDMQLEIEAQKFAKAFVQPDGTYPWE